MLRAPGCFFSLIWENNWQRGVSSGAFIKLLHLAGKLFIPTSGPSLRSGSSRPLPIRSLLSNMFGPPALHPGLKTKKKKKRETQIKYLQRAPKLLRSHRARCDSAAGNSSRTTKQEVACCRRQEVTFLPQTCFKVGRRPWTSSERRIGAK